MSSHPTIAILTPNTLTGVGLTAILERVIPLAEVELFADAEALREANPERFVHFFVSVQLFRQHRELFNDRLRRVILLSSGEHDAELGMHRLNICQSEERLIHDLLMMHRGAHPGYGQHTHSPQRAATLTEREAEVLRLLVRGMINKEIAEELGIGLTTVITHRRNMMEKLQVRSVAELMLYALREGFIDTEIR